MKHDIIYELKPEVPGGWGPDSIVTYIKDEETGVSRYDEIKFLHLQVEGWLGGDLLATNPCYMITARLAKAFVAARITGYEVADMKVTASEIYGELQKNEPFPPVKRLIPKGRVHSNSPLNCVSSWTLEDVCCSERGSLFVSKRCLDVIYAHNFSTCKIIPYPVLK